MGFVMKVHWNQMGSNLLQVIQQDTHDPITVSGYLTLGTFAPWWQLSALSFFLIYLCE